MTHLQHPELLPITDKFAAARVAVAGDLMLDRYIFGHASRLSPEAPVPIVAVDRETEVPGGAANVVHNVIGLKGHATVFGAVGNDHDGERLRHLLSATGADTRSLATFADRPTTIKTRVLANHQQVVRIDREDTSPAPLELQRQMVRQLCTAIDQRSVDAIIFEDYAKGILTREVMQDVVNHARKNNIITALDPHPSHAGSVRGFTLLTPNRLEAFGLAGVYYRPASYPVEKDAALLEVSKRLQDAWEVEHLLVTLGGDGMALFSHGNAPLHIPTVAREVFDVSGAGDTVIATFTVALLAGATPAQAAVISNHAAGVVVGKVGTVAITAAELREALLAG